MGYGGVRITCSGLYTISVSRCGSFRVLLLGFSRAWQLREHRLCTNSQTLLLLVLVLPASAPQTNKAIRCLHRTKTSFTTYRECLNPETRNAQTVHLRTCNLKRQKLGPGGEQKCANPGPATPRKKPINSRSSPKSPNTRQSPRAPW